ncbi:methionine--tRNA ligase subunit beta [Candidatus Uhrbacteria bacterium]|nr:methionine--tRNA ligase subunit beta [Candidatus Uhrbacteria bacterium]
MKETISYDDFAKVELRVGKILEAMPVEGSQKLLKLRVDIGDEKRQILAGIAIRYAPDSLVGKEIIVVANLAPRMMMGLSSQGMLLAADGQEGPVVLCPQEDVTPGAEVK